MSEREKASIMISSCLLGFKVRYDGESGWLGDDILAAIKEKFTVIPFCPEVEGGLPTPRVPAEIVKGYGTKERFRVTTKTGEDVSRQFLGGAELALQLCLKENVAAAILKERSPSCGSQAIYDGTFSGRTIPGSGVTTALLRENGIRVFSEENVQDMFALYTKEMR